MQRLVYNTKGNIFGWKTKTQYRFTEAKGRYWARWPSSQQYKEWQSECLEDESSEDCLGDAGEFDEPPAGIDITKKGKDQRVHNFGKAMHFSKHGDTPRFWKEMAISASNLLIRVIGDVVALFSAAFANNVNWDGECTSLVSHYDGLQFTNKTYLDSYPFASKDYKKHDRTKFARRTWNSGQDRGFATSTLRKTTIHDNPGEHFPHLWCILASKAPTADTEDEPQVAELYVHQACDVVTVEVREPRDQDNFQWDDQQNRYKTRYHGEYEGSLQDSSGRWVCKACIDVSLPDEVVAENARRNGYTVITRRLESRLECERVVLPAAFVRLFPRFVSLAKEWVAKVEYKLLHINECLGEIQNRGPIHQRIVRALGDVEAPERLYCKGKVFENVSAKAKEIVSLVRIFLLKLGAEDPRVCVEKYSAETIPLSVDEKKEISTERFASAVRLLDEDFAEALEMVTMGDSLVLRGRLWKHVPALTSTLLEAADPANFIHRTKSLWLRPPLKVTYTLKLEAQTLSAKDAGFCTPNGALLLVTPILAQWSRNTWSDSTSKELCFAGRIRPGDFFILVQYCKGDGYKDWRIKLFGVII
jgi:hypothetical protein